MPPTAAVAAAEPEVQPLRPRQRPPTGLLCILDDTGDSEGEMVRLRAERIVIGRTEGDIRIGHDAQISSRHAELIREHSPEGWRWVLNDLDSTNGTFVRVSNSELRDGSEFLVGGCRFRFEAATNAQTVNWPEEAPRGQTLVSGGGSFRASTAAALVEVVGERLVQRVPLTADEIWIGREAHHCAVARPDDILMNPRHARLFRGEGGQWRIANAKARNGVWLRVEQPVPVMSSCLFLIGEQRFLLKVRE
jgi:pSer/pThr/pTyr-binding forkhead associated (FHA) protein